jgi:hypothetical protein
MLEIEQKLIEIEKEIKTYERMCHSEFLAWALGSRKTLLQTTKECAENELEHLDYVIREINIDNITLENVIHTRIMNLKQTIDFINSQQIQNGSNKHDITTFDESKRVTIGKPTRPNDKTADDNLKIKKQEKE